MAKMVFILIIRYEFCSTYLATVVNYKPVGNASPR